MLDAWTKSPTPTLKVIPVDTCQLEQKAAFKNVEPFLQKDVHEGAGHSDSQAWSRRIGCVKGSSVHYKNSEKPQYWLHKSCNRGESFRLSALVWLTPDPFRTHGRSSVQQCRLRVE